MFFKVMKNFFRHCKINAKKIFFINVIFCVLYFLFFFIFTLCRFSEHFAALLKALHTYILYFLSIAGIAFVSSEEKTSTNITGFFLLIKKYARQSSLYAAIILGLHSASLFLLRMSIEKMPRTVTVMVLTVIVFCYLLLAYLPMFISLHDLSVAQFSFGKALKKSALSFFENPLIGLLLFLIKIIFRAAAIYSFFVIPSWILGDLIFLTFINTQPKNTDSSKKRHNSA